jgi:hypothetical protein
MSMKGLIRFGEGTAIVIVAAIVIGGNMDRSAPPRFDGAGYAVLGEALATGRGYREIDHPEQPRHAHYPPGYPAALALLWRLVGPSIAAAHELSRLSTLTAILAAWWWFRSLYPARIARLLGLALALNWTWGRVGGSIQSEPLYLLLEMLAIVAASRTGRGDGKGIADGAVLGLVLGACVLTRHVGICLLLAVNLDLWLRGRRVAAVSAGLVATIAIAPWLVWLALVHQGTQVELLAQGGLGSRLWQHALFYIQRIPDQLTGPAVEIGTVFRNSRRIFAIANVWAILASGLVVGGWCRALRTRRLRLAGLVPLIHLPLLVAWPFTEAGRFLVPLVPFILVGAVEGWASVIARAPGRCGRPRTWAVLTVLTLSLPYTAYSILTDRAGAQRRAYRDFDAACGWIADRGSVAGPVYSRHPGEVYWLTGRPGLAPRSDDPDEIGRGIARYHVAYLLIDEERYRRAPPNLLTGYVSSHPGRVRRVWRAETGGTSITVYAVVGEEDPPGTTGDEPG